MIDEEEIQDAADDLALMPAVEEKAEVLPEPKPPVREISLIIPQKKSPAPPTAAVLDPELRPRPAADAPKEIRLAPPSAPDRLPADLEKLIRAKKKKFKDSRLWTWAGNIFTLAKTTLGLCVFGAVLAVLVFCCYLLWARFTRPQHFAKLKRCAGEFFRTEPACPRAKILQFACSQIKDSITSTRKEAITEADNGQNVEESDLRKLKQAAEKAEEELEKSDLKDLLEPFPECSVPHMGR